MKHLSNICIVSSLLGFACSTVDTTPSLGTLTQAMRAGVGPTGEVFLGADLLVTETDGAVVPCDESAMSFTVSVSRSGSEGPFVDVPNAKVYRACSSASQGRVALVMDNSSSLNGELNVLQEAAQRVADVILSDGGQLSLTRVSTNASVLSPLTREPSEIEAGIDEMFITNGWTALYDGIRMGNQTLGLGEELGDARYSNSQEFCHLGSKQSIVVFTDSGENNSSHQAHWSPEYPGDSIDSTLPDMAELNILGSTTPIYTVGLGADADVESLKSLSQMTGGRHVTISSPNDVQDVLAMLADYGANTHRICTELPDDICGSLDVRIDHVYNDGIDIVEGSTLQHIELPCPERAQGRLATILLGLDPQDMGAQRLQRLMAQTVNWVSPVDAPKVLFVLDDFHHREMAGTTRQLHELLTSAGYSTDMLNEPRRGLSLSALQGYDVVWFSNPGYPLDDIKTYHTLLQFSRDGGGVVLQGDDMARTHGASFSMAPLTQLNYVDNGLNYCGTRINNRNNGQYHVNFPDSSHPILNGLAGDSFYYADDIDTATLLELDPGATREVLAWATVEDRINCEPKPVIVAYTPSP